MRPIGLITALALLASCTEAKQDPPVVVSSNVVQWSLANHTARRGPGNSVLADVEIHAVVEKGWHLYALTQVGGGPTTLTMNVKPPYRLDGDVMGPTPDKAQDPNFGIETETYSGSPIFRAAVKLDDSAALPPPPIEIDIRWQACSDNLCLPVRKTMISITPFIADA
ncbi:MAG: protein-disulfide reductase DsbD domain-containing protein [Gemmatimonadaceae bacterium]